MDMEFVRADATVTLTLNLDYALNLMNGIRKLDAGWVKSLTEQERNSKEAPDVHAVRILPNHIARAIKKLGKQLDTADITL